MHGLGSCCGFGLSHRKAVNCGNGEEDFSRPLPWPLESYITPSILMQLEKRAEFDAQIMHNPVKLDAAPTGSQNPMRLPRGRETRCDSHGAAKLDAVSMGSQNSLRLPWDRKARCGCREIAQGAIHSAAGHVWPHPVPCCSAAEIAQRFGALPDRHSAVPRSGPPAAVEGLFGSQALGGVAEAAFGQLSGRAVVHTLEQVGEGDVQPIGYLHQDIHRHVLGALLDAIEVGAVDADHLREHGLGDVQRSAPGGDVSPDGLTDDDIGFILPHRLVTMGQVTAEYVEYIQLSPEVIEALKYLPGRQSSLDSISTAIRGRPMLQPAAAQLWRSGGMREGYSGDWLEWPKGEMHAHRQVPGVT